MTNAQNPDAGRSYTPIPVGVTTSRVKPTTARHAGLDTIVCRAASQLVMKTLLTATCILLAGCTSFHVKQSDARTDRTVTSDLYATAWFSSAQHLEKLKALQTEKTHSFGTSAFDQQGATNVAATLQALASLLQMLAQAAAPRP